jgi:hypothetical protein
MPWQRVMLFLNDRVPMWMRIALTARSVRRQSSGRASETRFQMRLAVARRCTFNHPRDHPGWVKADHSSER